MENTIEKIVLPEHDKLIDYFEKRGISKEVIIQHARQVHFEVHGKNYFGLGIENLSGGFDVKNPIMTTKIGHADISVIRGNKEQEVVLFEDMLDALSFLQLLRDNNKQNNRTLILLNSNKNLEKFTERYKDFEGSIYLLLAGNKYGNMTTHRIQQTLTKAQCKDIRLLYQIHEGKNIHLNDYLSKKKFANEIMSSLVGSKKK